MSNPGSKERFDELVEMICTSLCIALSMSILCFTFAIGVSVFV